MTGLRPLRGPLLTRLLCFSSTLLLFVVPSAVPSLLFCVLCVCVLFWTKPVRRGRLREYDRRKSRAGLCLSMAANQSADGGGRGGSVTAFQIERGGFGAAGGRRTGEHQSLSNRASCSEDAACQRVQPSLAVRERYDDHVSLLWLMAALLRHSRARSGPETRAARPPELRDARDERDAALRSRTGSRRRCQQVASESAERQSSRWRSAGCASRR